MTKKYTLELIILEAYGETTPQQKQQLQLQMAANPEINEQLLDIVRSKKLLNNKLMSPSDTSLRIILSHSARTAHLQEI